MNKPMIVRDGYAVLNGNKEVVEMPSGSLEIVADDGRDLFSIRLMDRGIEVSVNSCIKHDGELLEPNFKIKPRASNLIEITREPYK